MNGRDLRGLNFSTVHRCNNQLCYATATANKENSDKRDKSFNLFMYDDIIQVRLIEASKILLTYFLGSNSVWKSHLWSVELLQHLFNSDSHKSLTQKVKWRFANLAKLKKSAYAVTYWICIIWMGYEVKKNCLLLWHS